MKRFTIGFGWLVAACVAVAGTGTSNEFRVDTRTGVRTAAATENIQYSTAWGGDTEDATHEIKAVVKVNPCLKTPPKYLVVDMSGGRSAARWPISYLDEVPSGGWTDEYKTEKLVLRYIPAGSFIMGGRATDYPGAVNTNLHMVTLTKPFYIGVFECTQRQWELAMGTRPSIWSNVTCYASRPVSNISYAEIRGNDIGMKWPKIRGVDPGSFMAILADKTGVCGYDLPTEARWEYACRAGTTTALNSGKNLSSMSNAVEMEEVGRFAFNSGVAEVDYRYVPSVFDNCDTSKGTAKVGSYCPNAWGLYDMHGNLWEWCLDWRDEFAHGSVDPVGPTEELANVVTRGGSHKNPADGQTSGYRGAGVPHDKGWNVGFRICLESVALIEKDGGEILINASGAAAADWTPTQAGTYQLTHEVQVDGTTVAPMESALFRVEGPELNIRPQGELTNGVLVKVEKVGGGGQWNIYYSLDGTTPTAGSTKYEGPFALPESATVKAVAISAGGVSSEVASKELALHPALAVEDTKARQRYPWNGKVDIDCEITGDATKKYSVTFSADDEVGHTNLPIRTVGRAGSMNPPDGDGDGGFIETALPFVLGPGKYRFVWDAAADLPKGTRFGGVSVSIDAEPSPMADWKRMVTISTDGYAGNETLTDVPVLVRLSSAIEGFDYADFAAPDTGADMIFTDMEGTARYPYEIDEWHKDGESLVWVKLPVLKKGTKFLLAYGNPVDATSSSRQNEDGSDSAERGEDAASTMKHSVWREYAGVWHMNEDSGTAFDSTEHGLDALPDHGTNKLADVSQMVAYENGACGRARVNSPRKLMGGNFLHVPSYGALRIGSRFVVSGWFNMLDATSYPKLISRSDHWKDGWGIESVRDDFGHLSVVGGTNAKFLSALSLNQRLNEGWCCLSFCYDGDKVSVFENGFCLTNNAQIVAATENGRHLAIGCSADGEANSLVGQYDEIRLRGGTLSADRIKADYDMIANRDFCTYGKVEAGPGAEPVPPSTTYRVRFNANGGTGTMADEKFQVGVAKALTANAFTRDGYSFEGWATSAGGVKVYEDKQSVSDLTTPGATVNLYAVWKQLGGVQLWEGGPYWAECNIGATKPEESGYYFWWGDTVGYKRNGSKWDAADGSKTGFSFTQENCPTEGMDNAQLQDAGYVDWNGQDGFYDGGNLVAAHDAATAHLGAPWRMPTADEISTLVYDCDWEWTKVNGVFGRKVKGRGAYASKQIFLPAAGYGSGSNIQYSFLNSSKCGHYWSSTAAWDYKPGYSLHLFFDSFGINEAYDDSGHRAGGWYLDLCYVGCTIRPVR